MPPFIELPLIITPITGLFFNDLTLRDATGIVAGGTCRLPIASSLGDITVNIRAIDGCIDRTVVPDVNTGMFEFRDATFRAPSSEEDVGGGRIRSPIEGKVIEVSVSIGDRVEKGQTLLVLEAMKLQQHVLADVAGVVRTVNAVVGAQVDIRQLLVEIEVAEASDLEASGEK